MLVTDTIRQIKGGLWAIEPHYALSLRETVEQIFAKEPNESLKKENLEARHYVLDENGNRYSSKQLHEAPNNSIGVIHISGPMIKYGNYYCWGADELVEQAKAYDKNTNIIGIIFVMDTGGGAVNSVAPYLDFLKTKSKPVIAWCDMCASAGYWVASACDYVMASNNISASFGSIGVMISLTDNRKRLKEIGVTEHIINASLSEHKNKAFQLALDGKYKQIKKELLDPLAVQFQETVKTNRPNLKLDVEGIISGKMFYAQQSVEIGLADSIGNFNQAVEKATELAAVQNFMSN